MSLWKKIVLKLIFPPKPLAALIVFPSFALLGYVFAFNLDKTWIGYVSYGLSAYSLLLICVQIPGVIRAFRSGFERHPHVYRLLNSDPVIRYRSDNGFRMEVSLYSGLSINLLFALFKLISGFVMNSLWFKALAGYYFLLAMMRFSLLHHVRLRHGKENLLSQWRYSLVCGSLLLLLNQALALVVALVLHREHGFDYPGVMIYAMAAYTFYTVSSAAIHMAKSRTYASPVMAAVRTVSFASALVALFSLETAMLSRFSTPEQADFSRIMISVTGSMVCAAVLVLAAYTIVRSIRQINILKREITECRS